MVMWEDRRLAASTQPMLLPSRLPLALGAELFSAKVRPELQLSVSLTSAKRLPRPVH
jgi:hypothetical protein